MNLKIPNPLNIRVASPGMLPAAARAQSLLGNRPAMVINTAQLRPGSSSSQILPQNLGQLTTQALAQFNPQAFAQVVSRPAGGAGAPAGGGSGGSGGQTVAQGVLLTQGTHLLTPMTITPAGDPNKLHCLKAANKSAGVVPVTGKMMSSMQSQNLAQFQGQITPVAKIPIVSSISSAMLITGQPLLTYATETVGSSSKFGLSLPVVVPSVTSSCTPAASPSSTNDSIGLNLAQTPKDAYSRSFENNSVTTSAPINNVNSVPRPNQTISTANNMTVIKKLTSHLSEESKAQENEEFYEKAEGDFDPKKVMEWQDGIGSLPGSSLKVYYLAL